VVIVAVLALPLWNSAFGQWLGQTAGEGTEFHVLALALALSVLVRGSGPLAVDHVRPSEKQP
jgi:uncharacterized membrane protein YphA (DoxX/SURF4 family)